MSIAVVGAYTRDLYMFCTRLPGRGETVEAFEHAEAHGGKAANQAVAVARLGGEVHLITRLGRDRYGESALAMLKHEGVDLAYVSQHDDTTGFGFTILDSDGQQMITTYAGASGRITEDDVMLARPVLERASALLLQGEIKAGLSMSAARSAGRKTRIILNPSPVETFSSLDDWSWVHLLILNEHEGRAILRKKTASAQLIGKRLGIPYIVLTLGAEGAELWDGTDTIRVAAPRVDVVDTSGAGDVLCAALAVALERGREMEAAARWACLCASYSVARRYCIPSFPTARDVPEGSESG